MKRYDFDDAIKANNVSIIYAIVSICISIAGIVYSIYTYSKATKELEKDNEV